MAVESLVNDLPNFMALLLEHGLDLKKFVTMERLEELYIKV